MSKAFETVATIVATLLVMVLVYAICTTVAQTIENHAQAEEIKTYEEDYLPGQSLDAVRINAPTFSSGQYAYKVCDRTSGASGWLVLMDGEWVYMPVTLGNQQLIGAPAPAKEGE